MAEEKTYQKNSADEVSFLKMTTSLHPTGRAFNLPLDGNFSKLHQAINLSLLEFVNDADATLDSYFPDNDNFDSNDADIWEFRYGIPYNPDLTLEQRMTNIFQRMAFPQNIKARQHPLYIEEMLNRSGFDVKVYENKFFDGGGNLYQKTVNEVLGLVPTLTQFSPSTQMGGGTQFGGGGYSLVANYEGKENYSLGGILWPTFFIAGESITTPADVQKSREKEFRRMVLKLKPAHTVALLIVNFI